MSGIAFLLEFLALAAIVGFTTFGCKNDDDGGSGKLGKIDNDLIGTWKGEDPNGTLIIAEDSWKAGDNDSLNTKSFSVAFAINLSISSIALGGSFDVSGGKVSVTVKGGTKQTLYTYKISDKTLTLTDPDSKEAFKGIKQNP